MASHSKDSGVSLNSFFARCGLPSNARDECDAYVRTHICEEMRSAPFQGYCSYTVLAGADRIIQFRPQEHWINVSMVSEAFAMLGDIVPEVEFLGVMESNNLQIYSMKRIPGVSLLDLRSWNTSTNVELWRRRHIGDFARIQAASWKCAKAAEHISNKGIVGSSMRWRLNLMMSDIPDRFRSIVFGVSQQLPNIEGLPWTLTHGDFLPSNIFVDQETGKLSGLIDWAEAEYLPFGVGIYGLEELLGEDVDGRFAYYPETQQLRVFFWDQLLSLAPELSKDPRTKGSIQAAQVLGILLWHAIAFDNGKLDRVVEEETDAKELQRLDAFLLHPLGPCKFQDSQHQERFSLPVWFQGWMRQLRENIHAIRHQRFVSRTTS
ncbi:hypothetical protein BX600DRAFT_456150 [Xylariales sp. PMI_506]|nr:hypothetical protein BX600DRAFT_456150 [Xylariales sp. PMI_506]